MGRTTKREKEEEDFNHVDKDSKAESSGTIFITLKVVQCANYDCVRRLEVTIWLQLEGEEKATEIGQIVAFLVDKSVEAAKQKPAWLQQLLKNGPAQPDKDQTEELHGALNEFFTKTGAPRAIHSDYTEELQTKQILYIHNFELKDTLPSQGKGKRKRPGWKGKGIGPQPLRMFLEMVKEKYAGDENEIVEVEKKLQKAYKKTGFETWIQGDEDTEGSPTYMGRLL